jgi:hypothetical protein
VTLDEAATIVDLLGVDPGWLGDLFRAEAAEALRATARLVEHGDDYYADLAHATRLLSIVESVEALWRSRNPDEDDGGGTSSASAGPGATEATAVVGSAAAEHERIERDPWPGER